MSGRSPTSKSTNVTIDNKLICQEKLYYLSTNDYDVVFNRQNSLISYVTDYCITNNFSLEDYIITFGISHKNNEFYELKIKWTCKELE